MWTLAEIVDFGGDFFALRHQSLVPLVELGNFFDRFDQVGLLILDHFFRTFASHRVSHLGKANFKSIKTIQKYNSEIFKLFWSKS